MNPTLTLIEAADVLKVHPKTVEDLIRDGVIPAAKIGRAWVMLSTDVLRYVEDEIIKQTAQRMRSPGRCTPPRHKSHPPRG
jgi:excisionase family DNA binding protein